MSQKDRVLIFDTTLRDGEQSPGASMTKEEKVRIAKSLERMRVDIIEAGFAVASRGDFDAVQAVANSVSESVVCSLARALEKDIDVAGEALAKAKQSRIHTFIATSPIHMQYKLKMEPDRVVETAVSAIQRARKYTDNVEFSCEDAGRSELDFLCRIIEQAIKAGAGTINIPDTVGYAIPEQFGCTIKQLIERIPNADQAIFSVHCHNDLGLAVANSLSAVANGARQVECTINGLGERAGNASLEEIVMAIRTRNDFFNIETGIDTTQIVPASKLVSQVTGFPVQPNKAIVGINAFAHESGIHQDGVLKHRETYEIMKAEDVGWTNNRMVLGKHSGRNAFRSHMLEIGIEFDSEASLNETFSRFKDLADKKHEIFDDDLLSLVSSQANRCEVERYRLESLKVSSETGEQAETEMVITIDGVEAKAIGKGCGPVDSAFKAIEAVVHSDSTLLLYNVSAITQGTDSQAEVAVRLDIAGNVVNGQGADLDIVTASVKAYLNALNSAETAAERQHPQQP
ncbi:MAG: 2-isopropylmalate synthase [Kangiellaceae bacterium]|jgi:2-isopropylmalate synthase|nr:2-isopropylmalate synthase [Kangiellaceae bacterium]|tara:strand:- start:4992 stop:6536 length:1545 start_codon:yes stop_codon:yes gene_type:complete